MINKEMYDVTITTDSEVITTTINDITELNDLLLKYNYISVDVKKKTMVKKLTKDGGKNEIRK